MIKRDRAGSQARNGLKIRSAYDGDIPCTGIVPRILSPNGITVTLHKAEMGGQ
jgi:hypothetical protein